MIMIMIQIDQPDARLLLRWLWYVMAAATAAAFLMLGAVLRVAWMLLRAHA